jgi:pimeloyl-ACP methyl ester carboxylesterase
VLRLTSANPQAHEHLVDEWARYSEERPVARRNVLRQIAAAARFRAPLRPPAAPVLVLASRNDRLVKTCCSVRLASAWNASIAIHPTAGHDLPLDEPAWVGAQVRDWQRDVKR